MRTGRGCFGLMAAAVLLSACSFRYLTARERPDDLLSVRPEEVSLNRKALPDTSGESFQFLVAGHLYGTNQGENSQPATTLLAHLPDLQAANLDMFVALGDIVQHSTAEDFDVLDRTVLDPLPFPVFNVVGNHDVEDRALYEKRYGQTYSRFTASSAAFIFVDTERKECSLDEEQLTFLRQAIQASLDDAAVQNIFLFMHKTLFFRNDRLRELNKAGSAPNVWDCYGTDFHDFLENEIVSAAKIKPVFLFAGDVGATGNLTPYFEQRADAALTMVMTGLGETTRDAGILVTIDEQTVRLEVYPLAEESLPALETFTPDYWIRQAEMP